MEKLLISSCLYGEIVTFKNTSNAIDLTELKKYFEFVLVCPEVMGGLSIPRPPSEQKGDLVFNHLGEDVTKNYQKGAQIALELCKKHSIRFALLKARSPSCGKKSYDGTFTHTLIDRPGVTVKLLLENGIEVFDESEVKELISKVSK